MGIRTTLKLLGLAAGIALAVTPLAAQDSPRVELLQSHFLGATPPMREYLATHREKANPPFRVFPLRKPGSNKGKPGGNGGGATWTDPVLQTGSSLFQNYSSANVTIDGIDGSSNSPGVVPPDTNISVGLAGKTYPAQIVETVNVEYAVYGTDGRTLQAATPIHTIFSAAQGNGGGNSMCASVDGGDPVVLYDKIDQRWIISQLAYNMSLNNDHFCLAISTSGDATGSYNAYDFSFGSNFPDYPKLGVWADGNLDDKGSQAGVYFSANTFAHGSKFAGAKVCAFPLSNVSNPPSNGITFSCVQNSSSVFSLLPADMEGVPGLNGSTQAAPSGTAEYYLQFSGSNTLSLYQFTPNFGKATGTVSGPFNIPNVAAFHEACGGGACIPQEGTNEQLDSLGDRLMYRLSYRNFGAAGGQSMVVTQSVQDSSSSSQTGIRWYQLASGSSNTSSSGWKLGQEGTFGPDDGTYRWMGSIAQDKYGDFGVGYSISNSSSMYPGIAFTGRTPSDGTATSSSGTVYGSLEPETQLNIGLGAQTSVNRWGDYSSLSVDPSDDCTFWYANEYLKSTGSYTNWGTYILSFKVGNCR